MAIYNTEQFCEICGNNIQDYQQAALRKTLKCPNCGRLVCPNCMYKHNECDSKLCGHCMGNYLRWRKSVIDWKKPRGGYFRAKIYEHPFDADLFFAKNVRFVRYFKK